MASTDDTLGEELAKLLEPTLAAADRAALDLLTLMASAAAVRADQLEVEREALERRHGRALDVRALGRAAAEERAAAKEIATEMEMRRRAAVVTDEKAFTLHGVVRDRAGDTAGKVRVQAVAEDGKVLARATTDADGFYTLAVPAAPAGQPPAMFALQVIRGAQAPYRAAGTFTAAPGLIVRQEITVPPR